MKDIKTAQNCDKFGMVEIAPDEWTRAGMSPSETSKKRNKMPIKPTKVRGGASKKCST